MQDQQLEPTVSPSASPSQPPRRPVQVLDTQYEPGKDILNMSDYADMFPGEGIIHAYAWWAAQATDTPGNYHIAAILPIICHEMKRRRFYLQGPDGPVWPTWWTCIVGESGVAKSTALQMAMKFGLSYWDTEKISQFKSPFVTLGEGSIAGLLANLAVEHYFPEFDATDAILYREEFSKVFLQEGIAETLIEIMDGRTVQRLLRYLQKQAQEKGVSESSLGSTVKNPRCCGLFATTPVALRSVATEHHLRGGVFSRISWIVEDVKPEWVRPRRINTDAARTQALKVWTEWSATLAGHNAYQEQCIIIPENVKDIPLERMFYSFYDQMTNPEHILYGPRRRALEQADVLAAIYALSRGSVVVSVADMEAATEYLERSLGAMLNLSMRLNPDELVQGALDVLKKIGDSATPISKADLLRKLPSINYIRMSKCLDQLHDMGLIMEVQPTYIRTRGRPSTFFKATEDGVSFLVERNRNLADGGTLEVSDVSTDEPSTDELVDTSDEPSSKRIAVRRR